MTNDTLRRQLLGDTPPACFLQSRTNWCWAACAKIVGLQYKRRHRLCAFLPEDVRACGDPHEYGAACVCDSILPDGLRVGTASPSAPARVDAWQRSIVLHAHSSKVGTEHNLEGRDHDKERAIRYVVAGDPGDPTLRVKTHGRFSSAQNLWETDANALCTLLDTEQSLIGNLALRDGSLFHSVVLYAAHGAAGSVLLYDPWDGFYEQYTPEQLFHTGVLLTLGAGVIRWIQSIQ